MKIITPAGILGAVVPSKGMGTQSVGSTGFQARLASAGSVPAASSNAGPTGSDIIQHAAQDMRAMLRLQYALSRGTDTLISNLMKARHETAKNSIGNIR